MELPLLAVEAAVETLGAVTNPLFWDKEGSSTLRRRGMTGSRGGTRAGELVSDVLSGAGPVSSNNKKCVVLCVPNRINKTGLICTHQDQLPTKWWKR